MGITLRQKTQMRDYVADRLKASGVQLRTKQVLPNSGIDTSYLLFPQNSGIVVLVDQKYPNDQLRRLSQGLREQGFTNCAFIFYKDGETFFRSAAAGVDETGIKSKYAKLQDDRSLKNYTPEDLRKMISFRPEEEFVYCLRSRNLQYYQPQSGGLEEGIESFKFEPVVFDYTHIPEEQRRGPAQKQSERLRIWTQRNHNPHNLELREGLLVPRKSSI